MKTFVIAGDASSPVRIAASSMRDHIGIAPNDGTDDANDMNEVDAKIAAAEARTATRFAIQSGEFTTAHAQLMGEISTGRAELLGQIRELGGRIDHVESQTKGIRGAIWGSAIVVIGILIAAMIGVWALTASEFSNGMGVATLTNATIQSSVGPRIDAINARLDDVIKAIQAQQHPQPAPPSKP